MGQRWKVPGDTRPEATVHCVGLLERQPALIKLDGPRRSVARCVLEVGDARLSIVAYNAVAEKLGGCLSGSVLTVDGVLKQNIWRTGEGKEREKIEIEATAIDVGPRSVERIRI